MNEDRIELRKRADESAKLHNLLDCDGWRDVLMPALKRIREHAMLRLVNSSDDRDIIRYQEEIKLVDQIFSFIETSISEGEHASEALGNLIKRS